jgi:hypothetical protein
MLGISAILYCLPYCDGCPNKGKEIWDYTSELVKVIGSMVIGFYFSSKIKN